jgi:hypothetical protein
LFVFAMARQQYLISKFLFDSRLSQADEGEATGESVPASADGDGCAEATSTPIDCPSVDVRTQVEESGGSAAQPPLPSQMSLSDSDCVVVGATPATIMAPTAETPAAASPALTTHNAPS